jgi:hypothetical protein
LGQIVFMPGKFPPLVIASALLYLAPTGIEKLARQYGQITAMVFEYILPPLG